MSVNLTSKWGEQGARKRSGVEELTFERLQLPDIDVDAIDKF